MPCDRLFWDHSTQKAARLLGPLRYKGIVIWMDREQACEMWPDAEDLISDYVRHADQQLRRPAERDRVVRQQAQAVIASCNATGRSAIQWWVAA